YWQASTFALRTWISVQSLVSVLALASEYTPITKEVASCVIVAEGHCTGAMGGVNTGGGRNSDQALDLDESMRLELAGASTAMSESRSAPPAVDVEPTLPTTARPPVAAPPVAWPPVARDAAPARAAAAAAAAAADSACEVELDGAGLGAGAGGGL